MNSTSLLDIKNISKTYHSIHGEVTAIENLSFKVNKGKFIGIIGPSGCGKSTILNIISKLDNDHKGKVINNNATIGYMIQEDALFPWLTILDNVLIGLKIKNELNEKNKEYAIDLLKKYGLYDFKDKYPSSLSGGMKQRVALIRTLAIKPDILLLDEPFSALDYQTRLKVSNDVYNIIRNEKKTVIMVTHDISEAISMCDEIIVLTKRPSKIKKIYKIELDNKSTPIKNREASNFAYYFKQIWKDIDA